jgi:branched-chain amino acid transport system ATP-binding protein
MMLDIRQVSSGYGDIPILHNVNLQVREGAIVALIGGNGAGKTTLLRTISGLLPLSAGVVYFDGIKINNLQPYEICSKGLIHVPEGRRIFPAMTVRENLEVGAFLPRARQYFKQSLELVFTLFPVLKERQKQYAGSLSGGEQQMLAIARGLMAKPRLLMLDEPTLGLAPRLAVEILQTLKTLNEQEGIAILLVSQEVFEALKLAHWAYVMENGTIVLQGTGQEILSNPQVVTSYLGLGV